MDVDTLPKRERSDLLVGPSLSDPAKGQGEKLQNVKVPTHPTSPAHDSTVIPLVLWIHKKIPSDFAL